jgi:hypothetical protein
MTKVPAYYDLYNEKCEEVRVLEQEIKNLNGTKDGDKDYKNCVHFDSSDGICDCDFDYCTMHVKEVSKKNKCPDLKVKDSINIKE